MDGVVASLHGPLADFVPNQNGRGPLDNLPFVFVLTQSHCHDCSVHSQLAPFVFEQEVRRRDEADTTGQQARVGEVHLRLATSAHSKAPLGTRQRARDVLGWEALGWHGGAVLLPEIADEHGTFFVLVTFCAPPLKIAQLKMTFVTVRLWNIWPICTKNKNNTRIPRNLAEK